MVVKKATKAKKSIQSKIVLQAKRYLAMAERDGLEAMRRDVKDEVSDPGTGATIIRLTRSPMDKLLSAKEIGGLEQRAADEIIKVVHYLQLGLGFGQPKMERSDKSYSSGDPPWFIDAYARYKAYGDHWSKFYKLGDPTWPIVYGAVYDERPLHILDSEHRLKHGSAKKTLIAGLKDYAARAGWVKRIEVAQRWKDDAASIWRRRRIIGEQVLGAIDDGGEIDA